MIGYIKQPVLGGMFSPKLNVMDREGGKEIATIQAKAKCCIGGMVSLGGCHILSFLSHDLVLKNTPFLLPFINTLVLQPYLFRQGPIW